MPYRVRLDGPVLQKLKGVSLSRNGRVRLVANLHYDLAHHGDVYSSTRSENDPSIFSYSHGLLDAGRSFTATFDVSDMFEPNTVSVFDLSWEWGT